jgi:hypothetical protein
LNDPSGLTVYACQEDFHDLGHYWFIYYGFSHAYLKTDKYGFGLYPGGPMTFDPAKLKRIPSTVAKRLR